MVSVRLLGLCGEVSRDDVFVLHNQLPRFQGGQLLDERLERGADGKVASILVRASDIAVAARDTASSYSVFGLMGMVMVLSVADESARRTLARWRRAGTHT